MSNREEVQKFLYDFNVLANVFDIIVIDTEKNLQALLDLGITAKIRKEIIMDLKVENYFQGPNKDRDRPQFDVWEFGYKFNDNYEIYIKLSTRKDKSRCICLSFHRAEHKIIYPYV